MVVGLGTVLMTLVPKDEPLQAEVFVRNEDSGFVHEGQRVKVKLAAYPFQKYGMLEGTVTHLGADASDVRGPQDVLGNAQFGTQAQSLRPLATLQEGATKLG